MEFAMFSHAYTCDVGVNVYVMIWDVEVHAFAIFLTCAYKHSKLFQHRILPIYFAYVML